MLATKPLFEYPVTPLLHENSASAAAWRSAEVWAPRFEPEPAVHCRPLYRGLPRGRSRQHRGARRPWGSPPEIKSARRRAARWRN